jgi:hypothetical protein
LSTIDEAVNHRQQKSNRNKSDSHCANGTRQAQEGSSETYPPKVDSDPPKVDAVDGAMLYQQYTESTMEPIKDVTNEGAAPKNGTIKK